MSEEISEETEYVLRNAIEQKENEIKDLRKRLDFETYTVYQMNALGEALKVKLRHQKYKRCIAMAWFCHFIAAWDNEVYVHNGTTDDVKAQLYWKWEKRWFALADKFKEKEA